MCRSVDFKKAYDRLAPLFTEERLLTRNGPFPPNDEGVTRLLLVDHGLIEQYALVAEKKQVVALHYPGEGIVHWYAGMRLRGLSRSQIRLADIDDVDEAIAETPETALLLRSAAERQIACATKWLSCISKRSDQRLAHFLCEFILRSKPTLSDNGHFRLPTQADIANMIATTVVHVNRLLRNFEEQNLIERYGSRFKIANYGELSRLGQFDGAYLEHL